MLRPLKADGGGERDRRIPLSVRVLQLEEGAQRPLMFDFGIVDLMLLAPADQEVYLVEFRCRCAVVVARGHVIRRTRGFTPVCEHVSVGG